MSESKLTLHVAGEFVHLATRPEGIKARDFLLEKLQHFGEVDLDFTGVLMTPSFADEFVGKLAAALGKNEFERRIHLMNLADQTKSLLNLVIIRQLQNVSQAS